ncbi:carboxypeptidase-like regulatory domain-containing protein [Nocardioides sp.]|jgi:hypothetical protein|uniref:carboxypeptidase-like regulatory domain-containing protein n=1 Tax=Nocardioides sp. TaxID=35761 RepID=UPI0031FE56F5|nr:hypothetical protein [Nocardioides sp.]
MRPIRTALSVLAAAALLAVGGCGDESAGSTASDSGVRGLVSLGPTCPVEQEANPCAAEAAADVKVTVSEQAPGEAYGAGKPVATGQTDADGRFRIDVPPGDYVVTSEAGMSCEFMDAHVTDGTYTEVQVPCDTGIR